MTSIASLSSPATSIYDLMGSGSDNGAAMPSDLSSIFSAYLDGDGDIGSDAQTATAGPLSSAQDNDILQQISAGDPKLGAKFEKDMKSGNKKAILNDIQNALHEGLISKDAASEFMQQPDMEKMFKGTHMATKKGYEDVVNEDDTRGFDGGKGGSDLLKAGDKYDFEQIAKYLLPLLALPLLLIPGAGDLAFGLGIGADAAATAGAVGGEAASAVADVAAGVGSTILLHDRTADDLTFQGSTTRSVNTGAALSVADGVQPITQDELTAGFEVAALRQLRARIWVQGRWLERGLESTPTGFDNPGRDPSSAGAS